MARTRYYQPAEPFTPDPVVTGSRENLRFESFGGCCDVYARMDVPASGLDGQTRNTGPPTWMSTRRIAVEARKLTDTLRH